VPAACPRVGTEEVISTSEVGKLWERGRGRSHLEQQLHPEWIDDRWPGTGSIVVSKFSSIQFNCIEVK